MSTTTFEDMQDAGSRAADGHAEMEAVRSLMDERRRFENWLETLETRREATPARVYERVRGDYERRLDDVIAELRGHTAMLRTTLADLNERAQGLRAEEETCREQRAEAELRAAVGEYSPAQWAELSSTADAAIERLSNGRGELTADLARVQEMLAHTEAPRTPPSGQAAVAQLVPAVEPEPATVAEPEPEPQPEPTQSFDQAPPSDEESLRALYGTNTEPALTAIDALGFDREVNATVAAEPATPVAEPQFYVAPETVAPSPFAPPAERQSPPAGTPSIGMLNGSMAFDELAFLKSVVGPRAGSSSADLRSDPRLDSRSDSRSDLRSDGQAPRSGPAAAVEDRVGRREGSSTPGYADAAKTLRCGECGTMNAPTEWYCERCGGELAAL